ncbi:MAG: 50S ribosomal protein L1 [Candidatus Omnitrophica bacterium]|nr:50S ribosomal protein L1 [Candidatus Omnitrophota bacterium]
MKKRSKRQQERAKLVQAGKNYSLAEAVKILKQLPKGKFDESFELHLQLGIKPDQSNEAVRGTASLPHGSGKKVRVLCFCKGEGARAAEAAGADYVGGEDYITKVQGGWMEFDSVIAHPDMMREVSKLGRVLGPRGLMPTPKTGTVSLDVAKAVKEVKAGRTEFKSDKTGGIHVACGKISFPEEALTENAKTVLKAIAQAKPASVKADYIKRVYVSTTQGPGLQVEAASFATKDEGQ